MKRKVFSTMGLAALAVTTITHGAIAQTTSASGSNSGSNASGGNTSGGNTTGNASGGLNNPASGNPASGNAASGNAVNNTSGTGTSVSGSLQGQGSAGGHQNMQRGSGTSGGGMAGMQGMQGTMGMMGMPSPLMPVAMQEAGDPLFALKASQGNSTEVATSQLALAKSQDARVRQFAERMIADHTRANAELTPLGASQGVVLPKPPGVMQQATAQMLQGLQGAEFDRQYLAGQVEAHENSITLFHHEALHGQDPQLRAYANRYLPALIAHGAMVYNLARDMNVPGIGERPLALLTSSTLMAGMPGMAGMHGLAGTAGRTQGAGTGNLSGGIGGGSSSGFNQGGNQSANRGFNAGATGNTGSTSAGGQAGSSGSIGGNQGNGGTGSSSSGSAGGAGGSGSSAGGTGTGGGVSGAR